MGWLTANFMDMSISSLVAMPASSILTAPRRKGVKSRVTMNPPTSGATTTVFPRVAPHFFTSSMMSWPVMMVLTSSRSCMTGAGLWKCMPITLSGRFVATAMSVTDRPEVLLPKIVPGLQMRSSSAKVFFFSSRSSGIASSMRSQSARSSSLLLVLILPMMAFFSSGVILPLSTRPMSLFSMPFRPFSIIAGTVSTATTS
ncbi:MAG: hypothetical protein A4E61_01570 [Syntrophorhabdus sp. PtaB.Bin184]|nr:MAG: hypothetical protein A4E61_01570 [Syntrophorhabdus sp. PtaB.Bin184]